MLGTLKFYSFKNMGISIQFDHRVVQYWVGSGDLRPPNTPAGISYSKKVGPKYPFCNNKKLKRIGKYQTR